MADYRAAFALAASSDPAPPPAAFRLWRIIAFASFWKMSAAFLAITVVSTIYQYGSYGPLVPLHAYFYQLPQFAVIEAGIVLIAVGLAVRRTRRELHWRQRLPDEAAQWKRAQRLRVRWNDAMLMLVGPGGFTSFRWHALFAWLEAGDRIILFTETLDPVPIPHAALGEGALDDLRARLAAAEVPREWRRETEAMRQVRHAFR